MGRGGTAPLKTPSRLTSRGGARWGALGAWGPPRGGRNQQELEKCGGPGRGGAAVVVWGLRLVAALPTEGSDGPDGPHGVGGRKE